MEEAYEFEQVIVGGSVPKNYFPAVEKGIMEGVQAGPLAAYPVVGVKTTLYDGSFHPVDSSENAFKIASKGAFQKGVLEARPVLLEPIASMKVVVDNDYTGDVMGDLNKRRGRIMGIDADELGSVVNAEVPTAEMLEYATDLKSMTQGRGWFSMSHVRYEAAPPEVADKVIAASNVEEE